MLTTQLIEAPRSDARFSPCRNYRYELWWVWGEGAIANFVLLNPSTADEVLNDPTVERCAHRARALGCGGIAVTNLFAYRSTDPRILYSISDPIGPENDETIIKVAKSAGVVICGWGTHGALRGRGLGVLWMLRQNGITPMSLGMTKNGFPRHPLYIRYETKLQVCGHR